jgi:hypothetical protein
LTCAAGQAEICLDDARKVDSGAIGSLRALLRKVELQWEIPIASGFSAHFQKGQAAADSSSAPQVKTLRLLTPTGSEEVTAQAAGPATLYCSPKRCLDELAPKPPFRKFHELDRPESRPPEAAFQPLDGTVFRPILSGRIVAMLFNPNRVKIYHGRNIFSSYSGFAGLRQNLQLGSLVNMDDTLGFVEKNGDSLGSLGLRIEKDGLFVNPLAFLGVETDTAGDFHGR